jgi:hypothetical protein
MLGQAKSQGIVVSTGLELSYQHLLELVENDSTNKSEGLRESFSSTF